MRILLNNFLIKKTLSIEEIALILKLKQRSCYLYITQLNDFLESFNLKKIYKYKNTNFIFTENVDKVLSFLNDGKHLYYSTLERKQIILFLILIYQKVEIKKLLEILNISFSLLRKDIISLMNQYKHELNYKLTKDSLVLKIEINDILKIRSIICQIIYGKNIYIQKFLENIKSNWFDLLISLLEEKCLLKISNYFKKNLVDFLKAVYLLDFLHPHLCENLFLQTWNLNCVVFNQFKSIFSELFCEEKILDIYKQFVKTTKLNFTTLKIKQEFDYFCYLVLSGNISWKSEEFESKNFAFLKPKVNLLLDKFEVESFLDIRHKDLLIPDLTKHIICSYFRSLIKFNFLLEEIPGFISKYNNYFLVMKNNINIIEKTLKVHFNETEICYILLYLISSIVTSNENTFNVAIDCHAGNSVFKFMVTDLQSKFDNCTFYNFRDLHNLNQIHLLITTSLNQLEYLQNPNLEVIHVNKFLLAKDIENIKSKLKELTLRNLSQQNRLNFYQILKTSSISEIIYQLSSSFLNVNINQIYVNNVLKKSQNNLEKMIINKNIVILHASANEGVIKSGFCIAIGIVHDSEFIKIFRNKIKIFIFVVPDQYLSHVKYINELISVCLKIDLKKPAKFIMKVIKNKWKTL